MRVEKLMSKDVHSLPVEQTLAEAAQIMWDHDCGCVPIVDGEGQVVGMVTDRDVCMAALLSGKSLHELPVRNAMARQLLTCRPDDTVSSAAAMMRRAQVRRLPVTTAAGRLVGVLSLNDLALAAERDRAISTPAVLLPDVALTLSALSHPRLPTPAHSDSRAV